MYDSHFAELLQSAQLGRLSRRAVLKRAAGLGLSAPAIAALLAACGGSATPAPSSTTAATTAGTTSAPASTATAPPSVAAAAATPAPATGKRGGGGTLQILSWEAPKILNAQLSLAYKDVKSIRIYAEPLADFNAKTELVPILAAEIPSTGNGGVAADGTSVTWKLRQGVKWHDGQPFTANDVKFTYQFVSEPKTGATTLGFYQDVQSVDVIDDYTVKVTFKHATAGWFNPFVGTSGQILPAHVLQDWVGDKAHNAPFNLMPIGTGPYKVTAFTPGDTVQFAINNDYWDAGKPYFDRVVVKGGGDTVSAARAVLQTGEADYAWELSVEPGVLQSMLAAGKGNAIIWTGGGAAKLVINHSDPQTEMDGQKSSYQVPHPHFKELKVRQALAFAIQRDVIASTLYGSTGVATGYTLDNNPSYMPKDITWEFNLDKANQLLDEVGAKPGPDGIRVLNGRKMSWVYTAAQSSVTQKTQEIIKAALAKVGIDVQIQAFPATVYFDAGNANSFQQLQCDLGMETNVPGVWPLPWYLRYYAADPLKNIAQKENGWSGRNIQRYVNPQFNTLYDQAGQQPDKAKFTDILLQMQDLAVHDVADIGLVSLKNVAAAAKNLTGYEPTPWAAEAWDIKNWRRTS